MQLELGVECQQLVEVVVLQELQVLEEVLVAWVVHIHCSLCLQEVGPRLPRVLDPVSLRRVRLEDESMSLREYGERLEGIRERLGSITHPNVLPFVWFPETQRSAFLVRAYVHSSLRERMTTRPFLTALESKWLTFQLLTALQQCEAAGLVHGDIKSNNILVTSWNWLVLSDLTGLKPGYLPEDNPADLSYFFDDEYHQRCYVAPERFYHSATPEALRPKEMMTCAIDVFAAGCVIAARGAQKRKVALKAMLGVDVALEGLAAIVSLANALFPGAGGPSPDAHGLNALCAFWMGLICYTCSRSKWIASLPPPRPRGANDPALRPYGGVQYGDAPRPIPPPPPPPLHGGL